MMWKRKELKKNAKSAIKRNYWGIIITCILVSIVLGYAVNPVSNPQELLDYTKDGQETAQATNIVLAETARQKPTSNTEIVDRFLGGIGMGDAAAKQWTNGVLSVVADNSVGAGSVMFGIMNTVNQIAFNDRLSPGIIIGIGSLISFLILIFLRNVLQVGFCRYLLEVRVYTRTRINRVMFPWHVRRAMQIVKITFLKWFSIFLWNFTVVGGIIKGYSYRLVPYIAAENPDLCAREVLKSSARLMRGSKWKAFLLDLSFLPWSILNVLTFNLLEIFFIMPYRNLSDTELYMSLRAHAKAEGVQEAEGLCDAMLDQQVQHDEYPVGEYMIPPVAARHWAHADYDRRYSVTSLILIFFSFSFIGWLWEVSLHLFKDGVFVNRGVLFGPWLPIYGTGSVIVLILLKKLRNRPVITFLATMALCGIVEYFSSWYLEASKGMRWWDYSGYFLNLNGRICLEGLLVFALGGCAAIYLIAPALDDIFKRIPAKIRNSVCFVLVFLFCGDQVYSYFHPNSGAGITDYKTADLAEKPGKHV